MSFNPFFEPENMSDDELNAKIMQLRQRFMVANYSQSSPQLIQSLSDMIQSIEEVQHMRMQVQAANEWNKMFPDIIESDPEDKEKRQEDAKSKTGKQGPRKIRVSGEIFQKEYLNQPSKKTPDDKTD